MKTRSFLFVALFTCMAFGNKEIIASSFHKYIPYPEGLSTNYISVNSVARKYLVYRPAGIENVRAVVFALHGGGGKGLGVADLGNHPLSVFRQVADSAKFLVVYPEGSKDKLGNPGWNDCRGDDVSGSQGDDLLFLFQLNARLTQELGLKAKSIFMTGGSNGAIMTFSYATLYPNTLGGIAVGSGNLPLNPEKGACSAGSTVPIPILLTHGTKDPAMPAEGGCVANVGGACKRGQVMSQKSTLDYWLQRNNLEKAIPQITTLDLDVNDAGNLEKIVYSGTTPVVYFKLHGAGHPAPSRTVFIPTTRIQGGQNHDIEFAVEVWRFFREFL